VDAALSPTLARGIFDFRLSTATEKGIETTELASQAQNPKSGAVISDQKLEV